MDVLEPAHVDETGEEDEGKWCSIILEEDADRMLKEGALAERAAEVGDYEDKESNNDGEVKGLIVAEGLEDLDPLLEVLLCRQWTYGRRSTAPTHNEGDVKAKDVAGEPRHVAEPVARVGDGEHPVENQGPSSEGWISGLLTCP